MSILKKSAFSEMRQRSERRTEKQYNQARTSNKRSSVSWYLKEFVHRLKTAELAELEKMLDCQEYEVPFDSHNDYYRRYKLEERIQQIHSEQEKQVESARKEFVRWLTASESDIAALKTGLINGKYHIHYDSDNDESRRAQLEEKLHSLQEKRKKEGAEVLNNLNRLSFYTACKLRISQALICVSSSRCRETYAKAHNIDFDITKYPGTQKVYFDIFCEYEDQLETIFDKTDPSDKGMLGNAYFEAATYCQSIGNDKAPFYYEKSAALGNEEASVLANSLS